jgi:hypothetical protein
VGAARAGPVSESRVQGSDPQTWPSEPWRLKLFSADLSTEGVCLSDPSGRRSAEEDGRSAFPGLDARWAGAETLHMHVDANEKPISTPGSARWAWRLTIAAWLLAALSIVLIHQPAWLGVWCFLGSFATALVAFGFGLAGARRRVPGAVWAAVCAAVLGLAELGLVALLLYVFTHTDWN